MGVSYEESAAAAGCDPIAAAQPLMEANAGEVSALSALFAEAAACLLASKEITFDGSAAASEAATIDDATPIDLMAEVTATVESLNATPEQLSGIAQLLDQIAGQIPLFQLKVQDALNQMDAQLAQVQASWNQYATTIDPAAVDPRPQLIAQAIGIVQAAGSGVEVLLQEYEDYLLDGDIKLQGFGYITPPEVSTGDDGSIDVPSGQPPLTSETAPQIIANWWAGLTDEQQAFYIKHYGEQLAVTHGLPAAVYDVVNRRQLTYDDIDLDLAIEDAAAAYQDAAGYIYPLSTDELIEKAHETVDAGLSVDNAAEFQAALALVGLVGLNRSVDKTQGSLASESGESSKYLLEYALNGPGNESKAVIAIGNPDSADNITVSVPGTDNGLDTIDDQVESGEAIQEAMNESDPDADNVVIVYEAYDNPDDIPEAMLDLAAEAGGQDLADDIAGWDVSNTSYDGTDPHITALGHSYGSLVVAEATQEQYYSLAEAINGGPSIDDVVVVGSPGLDVDSVEELGIDPEHFYAGAASDDPVVLASAAADLFGEQIIATYLPEVAILSELLDGTPFDVGLDYNVHNTPPTMPWFDGQTFSTDGSSGHSEYYKEDSESLANIGAISVGDYDSVTT